MPLTLRPKKIAAFSISEVVLAAFVLTTGIVAVMNLFSAAHRNSLDTRTMIIATGLAQEGAEIARNIRDNNIAYRAKNWTTGDNCSASMSGNCDPFRNFPNNGKCTLNYNSTTFDCSGIQTNLRTNAANGLYWHGAGTNSRFYRLVKVDHSGSADTARIQSFVTWIPGGPGGNLNNNGAVNWCTPFNQCVYTELFLTAWK